MNHFFFHCLRKTIIENYGEYRPNNFQFSKPSSQTLDQRLSGSGKKLTEKFMNLCFKFFEKCRQAREIFFNCII